MKKIKIIYWLLVLVPYCYGQGFDIGEKAPDIMLTNTNGDILKLSDLKGKMVLIDFWAAWCGPCRKENPHLVEAYLKYKDTQFNNGDGFTIFSVSLDMKKTIWENAIAKDSLIWPTHVSDLKGWKSAAAQSYNIKAIPMSYLIDGEGIIVAVNPRGTALDSKLKKLRKKQYFFF